MYNLLEDAEVHSIVETPQDVCCSPATAERSNAQSPAVSRCCAPAVNVPAASSLVQIQAKRAGC
jgi:hypothetical protein